MLRHVQLAERFSNPAVDHCARTTPARFLFRGAVQYGAEETKVLALEVLRKERRRCAQQGPAHVSLQFLEWTLLQHLRKALEEFRLANDDLVHGRWQADIAGK